MNILNYFSNKQKGVKANALSPLRPMTVEAINESLLIKLHNQLHKEFYTHDKLIAMEVTITMDDKKIWIGALDDIHMFVEATLPKDEKTKIFLVREFSPRVHYHGIILGTNTAVGKYMATIKRIFGRVSRIRHISYPKSYIPYMLKDMWYEMDFDLKRTVRKNIYLFDKMYQRDDTLEQVYTKESIQSINEERLQNKRTKKSKNI